MQALSSLVLTWLFSEKKGIDVTIFPFTQSRTKHSLKDKNVKAPISHCNWDVPTNCRLRRILYIDIKSCQTSL